MGLLDTKVLKPMRGAGSARLNAQRARPGEPNPRNQLVNRRGLLGSPQPITGGSPDFIQQLLQLLRIINRIDRGPMQ